MAARLNRPAAVLLDLDGTLLDSEPLWSSAARGHAERHGCAWSAADDAAIVGWSVPAVADLLHERGVPHEPDRIASLLHDDVGADLTRALPWQPGALDLLTLVRWAGVPCALVTMSYRRVAELVVPAIAPGTLRAVVTGDDVRHPKPHPEAYLRAARALGVDPHRCLAVEDSPTGVRSALAAGAHVVAVDPGGRLPASVTQHPLLLVVDGLPRVVELLASLVVRI